jgi:hypothetical protein
MSFKDSVKEDSKNIFLNTGQFAEEITYVPNGESEKIIRAVVIRYELAPAEENINRSLKKQAEVMIANDADEGMAVINKKDDRIKINDTQGIEREARIDDVLNSDDGMWHVLVGW